jgi:prefoldin subunit 5
MATTSDWSVFISADSFFNMSTTSVREGSVMVALGSGAEAVEDVGEGGRGVGLGFEAAAEEEVDAAAEDRLERDTRLSRALWSKVAGPRLRSS